MMQYLKCNKNSIPKTLYQILTVAVEYHFENTYIQKYNRNIHFFQLAEKGGVAQEVSKLVRCHIVLFKDYARFKTKEHNFEVKNCVNQTC